MQLKKLEKYTGLTVTVIFLVMILMPILVMKFTRESQISMVEKRRLAKLPEFHFSIEDIKTYPRNYENYFNDHFGLRSRFVWLYNSVFVSLLETSPNFDVIVGNDKWLFFATGFNYQDFTGSRLKSVGTLMEWKQRLEERQKWLAKKGIRYLLLPVPYKISVYSEYLPDRIQPLAGETEVEQFLTFLNQPPQFEDVIDVKKLFMEAKNSQLVYHKTDTHWNLVGAYIAYTAIINHFQRWFPEMQPFPWDELKKNNISFNGNLSDFINIGSLYQEDNLVLDIPDFGKKVLLQAYQLPAPPENSLQRLRHGRAEISLNPSENRSALVITDSFGTALKNFLAMNFRKIIFVQDARFEDLMHLIEIEHPDVVLDLNGSVRFPVALGDSIALRNESIKKVFNNNKSFYHLSGNDFSSHIKQIAGTKYKYESGRLLLQSNGNDPQLVFDSPSGFSKKPLYIHCRMTAPANTIFQIFYQTKNTPYYTEKNMLQTNIQKGINDIYLRLYEPVAIDSLRIDFGKLAGQYEMETFELSY